MDEALQETNAKIDFNKDFPIRVKSVSRQRTNGNEQYENDLRSFMKQGEGEYADELIFFSFYHNYIKKVLSFAKI